MNQFLRISFIFLQVPAHVMFLFNSNGFFVTMFKSRELREFLSLLNLNCMIEPTQTAIKTCTLEKASQFLNISRFYPVATRNISVINHRMRNIKNKFSVAAKKRIFSMYQMKRLILTHAPEPRIGT